MTSPTTNKTSHSEPHVAMIDAQLSVVANGIQRESARPNPTPTQPRTTIHPSTYFGFKYPTERIMAALLFVVACPVVLILVILVRATSRGPAIYRQKRVGLNGRVYSIYKIRTMNVDAESNSGPQWSTTNDPRVTRLGRLLRLLHLDELPQLANVIMGDMTIIGPRPERPEIVKVLMEQVDHYADRLHVKPGITGLAQIYLPPDETINCVRKKVYVDRAYINAASPLVDLQIGLCTIVRIVGLRKGRGPKWFGLDRRFLDVVKHCSKNFSENGALPAGSPLNHRNDPVDKSEEWVAASPNGHARYDSAHVSTTSNLAHSINGNGSTTSHSRNGRPEHPR